jgi:Flp pilus assembly pilin Flp
VELWRNESGATMVEYALAAALLAAASALAITQLGDSTHELIEQDKTYYEGGQ